MAYSDLILEKNAAVATITLNVPNKLNALTENMRESLPLAVKEINKDEDVRVVIVTGAGRAFCAGADVSTMTKEPTWQDLVKKMGESIYDVFIKCEKPVIAAINGPCVGAGFSLALTCDIKVASEVAKFGAAQISRGLVPDFGMTYLLPAIIGTSKAQELMYTAEIFGGAEAYRIGIVNYLVPPDDLMKTAQDIAAKICKQPPVPIMLAKRIIHRRILEEMSRQFDLETSGQLICVQTEDFRESARAFFEKRPPVFKGK